MARSYFNQLLRAAGRDPMLAPLRPVASLWKTAQIEAAAAGQDTEAAGISDRRASAMRRSRMADGGQPVAGQPAAPHSLDTGPADNLQPRSAEEIAPEIRPGFPIQPSPLELSPARTTRGTKLSRVWATGERSNSDSTPAAPATTATAGLRGTRLLPAEPRSLSESEELSASGRKFRSEPTSRPSAGTPRSHAASPFSGPARSTVSDAPRSATADQTERSAPVRRDGRAAPSAPTAAGWPEPAWAGARGEAASHPSATPLPFAERPISDGPARQPQPMPADRTASTRMREQQVALRQSSTADSSRSAERSGVQIGKIEVQIVPPPVTSFRPSTPAPPKDRLARGYALWPGW